MDSKRERGEGQRNFQEGQFTFALFMQFSPNIVLEFNIVFKVDKYTVNKNGEV